MITQSFPPGNLELLCQRIQGVDGRRGRKGLKDKMGPGGRCLSVSVSVGDTPRDLLRKSGCEDPGWAHRALKEFLTLIRSPHTPERVSCWVGLSTNGGQP